MLVYITLNNYNRTVKVTLTNHELTNALFKRLPLREQITLICDALVQC